MSAARIDSKLGAEVGSGSGHRLMSGLFNKVMICRRLNFITLEKYHDSGTDIVLTIQR